MPLGSRPIAGSRRPRVSSLGFRPYLACFSLAQPHSIFCGAESEAEVIRATEASVTVQAVLETEIGEHDALKGAVRTACEALEVEGVQSGSSLGSRLIALSGQVRERL